MILPVVFLFTLCRGADYYDYYDYPLHSDQGPGPPTASPATLVVHLNTSFAVRCEEPPDNSYPAPLLVHNSELVTPSEENRIVRDQNSFLVRHAQVRDTGQWACYYNVNPKSDPLRLETPVLVVVAGELSVLAAGRERVTDIWRRIVLSEDTRLQLTCALSLVDKKLDEAPLWEAETSGKIVSSGWEETGLGHNVASTSIQGHVLHRGEAKNSFTCRGNGQTITIQVEVEYQPEFTISRFPGFGVPITVGMMVSLKCSVDAHPLSRPVWEHNGIPVEGQEWVTTNTTEVTYDRIKVSDDGWFSCSTEHKFGNFSSVGYYLGVKSTEGGTEVGLLSETSSRTTSSQLADQVRVVEAPYQPAAEKHRLCGDEIDDGTATTSHHSTDHTRPNVTVAKDTVEVLAGDHVQLVVDFCSNPVADRVFWSGPNLLLEPGRNVSGYSASVRVAGPGCQTAVLDLLEVNSRDTGLYLLIVRNSYHVVEGRIGMVVSDTRGNGSLVTSIATRKNAVAPLHNIIMLILFLKILANPQVNSL